MEIQGYRILREIGQGGMATVYLAVQESLNRNVALKVMSPALLAADPSFGDRFLTEGRTVAQLRHPGIVQVYGIGASNDSYYLAMEYLSGGDLAGKIQRGLSEVEALDVLRQLAVALAYAHGKGYVHRDIKPENVLFDDVGRAVLTDFGIARATHAGARSTQAGMTIGTPQYMSPEQARAQGVDGRSDLYGLGVLLYEMLTGNVPYDAEDSYVIGIKHINDPLPVLPARYSRCQSLLERMMAKDPANRFSSADELLRSLEALAEPGHGDKSDSFLASRLNRHEGRPKTALYWTMGGAVLALALFGLLQGMTDYLGGPQGSGPVIINSPEQGGQVNGGFGYPDGQVGPSLGLQQTQEEWFPEAIHTPEPDSPETESRPGEAMQAPSMAHDNDQEQDRQAEIGNLLSAAEADILARRLTLPAGNNAFEKYQRVLEQEPDNPLALQGLKNIVQAYLTLADQAIASKRFDTAARHLDLADTVLPGLQSVMSMRDILAQARREHAQELEQLAAATQSQSLPPAPRLGDRWTESYTGMQFVWVPGGCFQMGCGSWTAGCIEHELPAHEVCVNGFWLGKYEVTQAQWLKVMNYNPSYFEGPDNPVETVSWNQVQNFFHELNSKTSATFRLPTEAEWEYACTAMGRKEKYCGGNNVDLVAWYVNNSGGKTHPVGGKAPNALGLHDMSGNVWEWVEDGYESRAYDRPGGTQAPVVDTGTTMRVDRGGAWDEAADGVRASHRGRARAHIANKSIGFRVLGVP